jgi:hypothetical protein
MAEGVAKPGTEKIARSRRLVVQHEELAGIQREGGVRSTFIIQKLHLKHIRAKCFYHRPHLPSKQAALRDILSQGDHIKFMYILNHEFFTLLKNIT